MSDDKVLSAIDLAESECRAWLGEVAVNGSVSGAANARMHRMFQAIRDSLVERAGEPVAEPMYGEIAAPQDALYEQAAAMDNQDVPLEEWPDKLIGALARSGYAVVPCSLPPVVLGEAYISGAFDTGNPKHGWDYLLSKVRAYPRFNTAPGASHER